VHGKNFAGAGRASVTIGAAPAPLVVGSDSYLIVRVPEDGVGGQLVVSQNGDISAPRPLQVGVQIADGLHPIANPAVDSHGNIYATFSGSRGQKTPVSVFQVDAATGQNAPFVSDLMNASGLAIDHDDVLYVSSRQEGNVYRVSSAGNSAIYVEGMGVATGIVFDPDGNLYVGDRSGTIFKVSRQRQIYVFATLESSISAYHLAFGPDKYLYVTGPTTSSFDCVHRISPAGAVEVFYRGLGRPQGMAFDAEDNLYVAASFRGRRGVARITPDRNAELFLSGPGIVGLAFAPGKNLVLATSGALYRVHVGIDGRRAP
jgi:sugar lactone lactonase YvrE